MSQSHAISVGVLTVSDRVFKGINEDASGPLAVEIIEKNLSGAKVEARAVVADEITDIQRVLREWADEKHLDLIITTGGTGFAPRDVTPEATKPLLDREAPGLVIAMVTSSLRVTPHAMLSRPAAGMRKRTLIINLPGSAKAVKENLEVVLPVLPHAVGLLKHEPDANSYAQHHKLDKPKQGDSLP